MAIFKRLTCPRSSTLINLKTTGGRSDAGKERGTLELCRACKGAVTSRLTRVQHRATHVSASYWPLDRYQVLSQRICVVACAKYSASNAQQRCLSRCNLKVLRHGTLRAKGTQIEAHTMWSLVNCRGICPHYLGSIRSHAPFTGQYTTCSAPGLRVSWNV